jgi:NADH-quinone oxidoreductase subunit E
MSSLKLDTKTEANDLIKLFGKSKEQLIPILQEIQKRHGYLPEPLLKELCGLADFSEAELFGVATFYSQFRFTPRGRHPLKVCTGTACHIAGATAIVEALQDELQIKVGETSQDGEFSLETVACLGCCSLAPVLMVRDEAIGQLDPLQMKKTLSRITEQKT